MSSSSTTGLWRVALVALLAVGGRGAVRAEGAAPELSAAQQQQAADALRQYCLRRTSQAEADAAAAALSTFVGCARALVDVAVLEREIEEAKPRGALDEVFKKYCDKSPQLKSCIGALVSAVEPCLEEAHRENLRAATNLTDSLIDFVCFKDGDRIAMFIAEHGPECLQAQATQLQGCFNNATSGMEFVEVVDTGSTAEQCRKLDTLSACAVRQLEGCESPTPANMAESLFRFMRRFSPCKDQPQSTT